MMQFFLNITIFSAENDKIESYKISKNYRVITFTFPLFQA